MTNLAIDSSLEKDATAKTVDHGNGTKTIYLKSLSNNIDSGVNAGIILQHEAYRDGKQSLDQKAETHSAVKSHTEMAINIFKDGVYRNAVLNNGNLLKDIGNYMKGESAFREYSDKAYDSSKDYWRINDKGNLEYDGRANVYDKDGNLIHETKSQGIEGSMLEILGLEDNDANRASVVAMMKASGLEQNTEGFWIGDNETIRRRIPQGGMSYFYTENGVNLTNLNMGKEITLQSVDSLYSDINAGEKTVKGFMSRTYGSAIGMINNIGSYTDAVNNMLSKAYSDSEIKKIHTNREWLNNAVENGIDLSTLAPGASVSTNFAEDLRMLALESSSKPGAKFFSELHTGIDFGGGGDSVNTPGGIWQLSRKDDHRLFFELFGSDVKMRIMHLDPDDVAGMSIGDYFGKDSSPAFITNYPTASNGTGTALHTHFDFTGFRLNPAAGQYDRGFLNPVTLMPGNQWNYPYSYMDESKNPLPGYPSNFWIY